MTRSARLIVSAAATGAAYGAAVYASLIAGAAVRHRPVEANLETAFFLFACGAGVACLIAWVLATWLGRRLAPPARLALILILLVVGTAGGAAYFMSLEFRVKLADFLPPLFSLHWFEEASFNGAAVAYTFTVLGLPLFLPFGLVPLFAAAFAFMRAGPRL